MSDEDKKNDVDVNNPPENKEGDDKHPETVPWNQYVGIKESLGSKLEAEKTKVSSLEEKLKNIIDPEEHDKIKKELEETKGKLNDATEKINASEARTLSEKRDKLVSGGVPEEKVKDMSDKELDAALIVLGSKKAPGPDLGGGGGSASSLEGSPMDLARRAYSTN
jgi:nucleotide-binding universal stress UspA family protein